jgi:capsule biosynthesis phosphatase
MPDPGSIIIDVDGTICPIKKENEEYSELIPFPAIIEKMHEMKAAGFRIVLYTSRNMNSYKGNLGLINVHTAKILMAWLEKWDIPFDEIVYGKPWPGKRGFYVDDRTIRPDEFVNLTLGEIDAICEKSKLKHLS